MNRFSRLIVLAALLSPTAAFAQAADGSVAPAPTAALAQPRAAAQNPNVIVLPPVNTTFEIPVAATAPSQPWRTLLIGAFAGILSVFGVQTGVKKVKSKGTTKCSCCGGSGRESSCDACATCNGAGVIDADKDLAAACAPCGGSGEETCTNCDGQVEMPGDASCAACALTGKNRDDGGEPVACGFCEGEGELSANLNGQIPCPNCQ